MEKPRYNVAPTEHAPVLLQAHGRRVLDMFRWGLIPYWAKDASIGNRMINARAEGIVEKPAFRASFERRRCLVLVDGWFEWKQSTKPKTPYLFRR